MVMIRVCGRHKGMTVVRHLVNRMFTSARSDLLSSFAAVDSDDACKQTHKILKICRGCLLFAYDQCLPQGKFGVA